MSTQDNLISPISSNDKIKQLERELSAALELIANYEELIAELKNTNQNTIKKFTHDLSSPLQILSMTIESMDERIPPEFKTQFERIKKSSDSMLEIIGTIRKLRTVSLSPTTSIRVV